MELIKKLFKNKKAVSALVLVVFTALGVTVGPDVFDAIVTLITASAEVAG